MKRLLLASALALVATFPARASFADGRARLGFEARLGGIALDDDWKDSVGAFGDFGFTLWSGDGSLGLWAGLGVQGATLKWDDGWGPVDTDITAVPFGASLLLRAELATGIALRGEIGARYVAMDIDDDDGHDHGHHRRLRDAWDRYHHPSDYLDIDDTSFAIATLQLEFNFDPVTVAFGGGYQFDLEKPDVTYDHETIFETDLSGALFFATFGVVF